MATENESPLTLTIPLNLGNIADTFDQGRYHLILGLSPEMNALVEELALRSGGSKADLLNRAIVFYKIASDAVRGGKRVGIADADQDLETEFEGF